MKIETQAIDRAFEAFRTRYKRWDMDHHVDLWADAQRAFERDNVAGFVVIYNELRSYWQIGRGKGAKLAPAEDVFKLLASLPRSLRHARLTDQTASTAPDLLAVVTSLKGVKVAKSGVSIMAISKFLHFFNPRLFLIVDRAMIWDWALNHSWINDPIRALKAELRPRLAGAAGNGGNVGCDPLSYISILIWAGGVLRENPAIASGFASFLRSKCGSKPLPTDLETYDAVAMEWLLLGLVELPPPGVVVDATL